ncbi:MAG: MBL fold metallo-hydrolase [Clostridiales bacterium]|nr:MBL fold metallo-hydrolase [Clostridiales bacterium]
MSKNITLTWRGHSCFKITCEGYSIVMDPYGDEVVPGLPQVREEANEVICSHDHKDHNSVDSVTLKDNGAANPFEISKVACAHDDEFGSKRGMNFIHIFDNGELRVAHFGDIGCPLNEAQLEAIGKLDAAMVPVGGYYTMEPDGILELMHQLNPRVVIPMHYRSDVFGYPVIGTLEDYLKLEDGNISVYDGNSIEITPDMKAQTAILQYRG